jgi:hypothetical protein
VATTPLPWFAGDFDHFSIDLKGKRLFLTAEDHKSVEIFDLDGKRIQIITGFAAPHAILFQVISMNRHHLDCQRRKR